MVTDEIAAAAFKIGEGWQELSLALARLSDGQSEPGAPVTELDVSGETVEGRRRRQAIVLRAFEKADGRLHKDDFYKVAQSVGYDNRGLAGFSTKAADLVQAERQDRRRTGYRVLTDKGRERLDVNRHLLPPE